ncbi:MAG TPA: branched-chain amino acid ABC transporter permease [Gammaproteobacteria bacterium]|nr:branched-chain amino acid ABC transporter permease [Gammaproteobacteria bacterium]
MWWSDRTVVGVTVGFILIAIINFFVPDWIRQIGLLSMAIGSVALGLLVLWRSGLISFGHALYYGFSAYGVALLNYLGLRDAFLLVIISAAMSGLLAWGLGFLVRRYRAIFFALLTMAFSMILYGILAKTERFGSTDGLNVHPPTFFGYAPEDQAAQISLFLFGLGIIYFLILGVQFYLRSILGHMTMAVRENEIRVEYLGYSVERVVHIKYVISGLLAGFGGAIMALAIGQVDPESMVYWTTSGEFVFVAILSGTANVAAPFVGAVVFEVIRHYAWEHGANLWQLIMGGTLLAIIMFMPDGIWSLVQRIGKKQDNAP